MSYGTRMVLIHTFETIIENKGLDKLGIEIVPYDFCPSNFVPHPTPTTIVVIIAIIVDTITPTMILAIAVLVVVVV